MKKHIPNLITLLNLLCGCIALVYTMHNKLDLAAWFVLMGIGFDFFDGFVARLLKVSSAIGVQLDSLADMVTSGVVPGVMMFQLFQMALAGSWQITTETTLSPLGNADLLPYLGFLIPLASAYRLAKFNVDENQVYSFTGLPTPANTLLIISLPLILMYHQVPWLQDMILNPLFLVGVTFFSAFMLNAPIQLMALKMQGWGFKENGIKYLFLIGSLVLLLTLKFIAVPIVIGLYLLLGLLKIKG